MADKSYCPDSENPDGSIGMEVPHAKAMVAIHTITMDSQQGYNWTVEFLADYKRRSSKDGKHMMGMMLRADNHQCSKPEHLAPSDWKNAKATGDTAPITLTYADSKQAMSKLRKLICADVLSTLTTTNNQPRDISYEVELRDNSGGGAARRCWWLTYADHCA